MVVVAGKACTTRSACAMSCMVAAVVSAALVGSQQTPCACCLGSGPSAPMWQGVGWYAVVEGRVAGVVCESQPLLGGLVAQQQAVAGAVLGVAVPRRACKVCCV